MKQKFTVRIEINKHVTYFTTIYAYSPQEAMMIVKNNYVIGKV